MITLKLNEIKQGLKQLFKCDCCGNLVLEPIMISCLKDPSKTAKFCRDHIGSSDYFKCPVCNLNHKIKSDQKIPFESLEYATNLFETNFNLESVVENFSNLIENCNSKFKYYLILNEKPEMFLDIFFNQAICKIADYMEDYKVFLEKELESLNEKIEDGFYKAINKYANIKIEESLLRSQIKNKILEFNFENEKLKQKFFSLKFTEKDLIQLQFLIVRLHSFNFSLSEELFPDKYILETPSELLLKKNLGFYVKTPNQTKDYDFETTSENILFFFEIQDLKNLLRTNETCFVYENEANDHIHLNIKVRFVKDYQNPSTHDFIVDATLIYFDETIEEIKGKVKLIFWNINEFGKKTTCEIPKFVSWNYDIEFNSKNTTESFKTFSDNDLFSSDVYSSENDSIVIGMKFLINHIQLPSPILSPKLDELVAYVKNKLNNDPDKPKNFALESNLQSTLF